MCYKYCKKNLYKAKGQNYIKLLVYFGYNTNKQIQCADKMEERKQIFTNLKHKKIFLKNMIHRKDNEMKIWI